MNIGELIASYSLRTGGTTGRFSSRGSLMGNKRATRAENIEEIQDMVGVVARSATQKKKRSRVITSRFLRSVISQIGKRFIGDLGHKNMEDTVFDKAIHESGLQTFEGYNSGRSAQESAAEKSGRAFRLSRGQAMADLMTALNKANRYL